MATNTSNVKKPCCKCNKGGSTFTCNGCDRSFCLRHTGEHRQELAQQMDSIGQQHDVLKRDVTEQNVGKTILTQIDRWEKESIEKIRSSAEKARADLQRFIEESKDRLNIMIDRFSHELRSKREDDDYTEQDLDHWTNQLKTLREELEKPSRISLSEDAASSFRFLKLQNRNENQNNSINISQTVGEQFNLTAGSVILSKADCCATCTSTTELTTYASVCGRRQYSRDIFYLRFRVNTSLQSAIFFGVMTSSAFIDEESCVLPSTYGYWTDGRPVASGNSTSNYNKTKIHPNDTVVFTIDCPSSKITYLHERTQQRREMKVDQTKCPFPWKLVLTLWYPNDRIELLQD